MIKKALLVLLTLTSVVHAQPSKNDLVSVGFNPTQVSVLGEDYPSLTVTGTVTAEQLTSTDDATIADTLTAATVTASGTVSAEQLTSTDDATVTDNLTVKTITGDGTNTLGITTGSNSTGIDISGGSAAGAAYGARIQAKGASNGTGNLQLDSSSTSGSDIDIIVQSSDGYIQLWTNATARWKVDSNGDFQVGTDSTYDIGTDSVRIATIYADTIDVNTAIDFGTGQLGSDAGSNLGLTGQNAANTACDTTCTHGCIAGFDTGSSVFVACTDATADTCLCATQ